METILLLAHTEADGTLARPALEALAAVKSLGGEFMVGLVGAQTAAAANQIAASGASRMLAVTGDAFAQARYATDAAAAEALCKASGAQVVIAPSTSRWARALPGVAGGRFPDL
jgi:electron transfer flavoprotein alpha subunit